MFVTLRAALAGVWIGAAILVVLRVEIVAALTVWRAAVMAIVIDAIFVNAWGNIGLRRDCRCCEQQGCDDAFHLRFLLYNFPISPVAHSASITIIGVVAGAG